MKFFSVGILAAAALTSFAQTAPAPQSATPQPKGQVIFSRSTDENGQTTESTPAVVQPSAQQAAASTATDAERKAVTFTSFDLDLRLHSAEQQLAVRALLTVRNDGTAPLARIPLQLSSSLRWERIRTNGRDIAFQSATVNSDADHTGQLHEAVVALPQPLAPGASLPLEVTYSGTIAASAQRLLSIGTPAEAALHSDWDEISVPFTGLRGFGNVLWYPASSAPVLLGDGARIFDEIGEHKLRLSGAHFRLRLTVEFPHGKAPTVAVVNGHSVPLTLADANALDQAQEVSGVATALLDGTTLGYEAPSLFVATRTAHPAANLTAWTLPEDNISAQSWLAASTAVTPFLQSWLGPQPQAPLTLLDLPDSQDAPFATGALMATSLRDVPSDQLNGILVHALASAWRQAPKAWLNEGVAYFMATLWLEKLHGRDQALTTLEAGRTALALAEPESPGQSSGQPLAQAISPVYYRTKAAYVLWMLRDIVGDETLAAALRNENPAVRNSFERLLEEAVPHHDLGWFFADWVNADKGLPDLAIASVFPSVTTPGSWLVAVSLTNNGYAAAEVPVTVRGDGTSVTQRVLIPARGKAIQRILIQRRPTEVQLNDGAVPETQASIHVTKLEHAEPQ